MSQIMIWVKNWVYNISVFIILISLIEILMPHKHYKKYIKLILGLIFILIVIEPILIITGSDEYFEFKVNNTNLIVEQESLKSQLEYYSSKQQEIAKEQISNLLITQIQSILASNKIILLDGNVVCEDDDDGFGEIKSIRVLVADIKPEDTKGEVIQPIVIEKIEISNDNEDIDLEPEDNKDILLKNKVRTLLSEYYMIDKEKISVLIYSNEVKE